MDYIKNDGKHKRKVKFLWLMGPWWVRRLTVSSSIVTTTLDDAVTHPGWVWAATV